jgi:hypothetical protein
MDIWFDLLKKSKIVRTIWHKRVIHMQKRDTAVLYLRDGGVANARRRCCEHETAVLQTHELMNNE